jgi:hypothetical protein
MKKFIVFLFAIIISYKLYYYKELREIEIRADYIISLMENYYETQGYYPERIEHLLDVELVDNAMMYNSEKIPGKGYFIILYDSIDKDEYGNILIVGGWGQPNVIYFPKIRKKEINSTYISSKF